MDVESLDPKGLEAMDGGIPTKKARTSNNSFNLTRIQPLKKSSSIEYNFEFFFVVFIGSQFVFMNCCYNKKRARKIFCFKKNLNNEKLKKNPLSISIEIMGK
jgi:hypothetical protein